VCQDTAGEATDPESYHRTNASSPLRVPCRRLPNRETVGGWGLRAQARRHLHIVLETLEGLACPEVGTVNGLRWYQFCVRNRVAISGAGGLRERQLNGELIVLPTHPHIIMTTLDSIQTLIHIYLPCARRWQHPRASPLSPPQDSTAPRNDGRGTSPGDLIARKGSMGGQDVSNVGW
jgi:hypothetical protein